MSPLSGIRVLDLTRLIPGPYATMVLADLGAQVDKVEEPGAGDYLRHMPPLADEGMSAMFVSLNRNKRSACIDLKQKRGVELLLKMVPHYDVLIEQFRPGVLQRLGLAHEVLRAANPRLVVCALTGYGQDGPLSKRAGHDINYLARAGVLGTQGPSGRPPQTPGFQLADVGGGLWSALGVVTALFERERTGVGSVVDVSMTEVAMGFASAAFGGVLAGASHVRGEEPLTGGLAVYGTYETRDSQYVAFGALEPKFWKSFCDGAGLEPDMSALLPGPHQDAIRNQLRDLFRSRTRDEWAAFGAAHDCCLEPVLSPNEALHDRQHMERDVFFSVAGARGATSQMRTPLTPRRAIHQASPHQGEQTEAILFDAGVSRDEYESLLRDRIVCPATNRAEIR